MTKQDIFDIIDQSKVDESVKGLARSCINQAYDVGFADGVTRGSEIMSSALEMVMGSGRKAQ